MTGSENCLYTKDAKRRYTHVTLMLSLLWERENIHIHQLYTNPDSNTLGISVLLAVISKHRWNSLRHRAVSQLRCEWVSSISLKVPGGRNESQQHRKTSFTKFHTLRAPTDLPLPACPPALSATCPGPSVGHIQIKGILPEQHIRMQMDAAVAIISNT